MINKGFSICSFSLGLIYPDVELKLSRKFRDTTEFSRQCFFDDLTKTICVISTDSIVTLIGRETKSFRQFRFSNEILSAGLVRGDKNGQLFINLYKVKSNVAALVRLNLVTGESTVNEYEQLGDTTGIDVFN